MVASYLNFVFFIEVKAKSKYRILKFVFQFISKTKCWVHGFSILDVSLGSECASGDNAKL